jgi:hypothetical protein
MPSISSSSTVKDLCATPLSDCKKRLARLVGRRRLGILPSQHTCPCRKLKHEHTDDVARPGSVDVIDFLPPVTPSKSASIPTTQAGLTCQLYPIWPPPRICCGST